MFLCSILLIVTTFAFATGGKATEKVPVRILYGIGAMSDQSKGSEQQALIRKFGDEVEFKFEPILWSAWGEKFPVLMASRDIADWIEMKVDYLPSLTEGELIIELDDNLLAKHAPEMLPNMREAYLKLGFYKGKRYMIPQNGGWYSVFTLRMDWLDKLNLKPPKTMAEFKAVAKAFTYDDPDGNGKQDTWAYNVRKDFNFTDWFFGAYGVLINHHFQGNWSIRNGKQTFDWVQPEMKEALLEARSWYEEGLFYPDVTSPAQTVQDNGQTGMVYHLNEIPINMMNRLKALGIESKWIAYPPPTGPRGESGLAYEGMPWGQSIGNNSEAASIKALEIYNYTFTQEYFLDSGGASGVYMDFGVTNEKGWPVVVHPSSERAQEQDYKDKFNKFMETRMDCLSFAINNPDQFNTWKNKELGKYVFDTFQSGYTDNLKYVYGEYGPKYAFASSKTGPVPAEAKNFPNLQNKFREVVVLIAADMQSDPDKIWDTWINYYKNNGGPEIEAEVNEIYPVK
jgi:hypothetical protein